MDNNINNNVNSMTNGVSNTTVGSVSNVGVNPSINTSNVVSSQVANTVTNAQVVTPSVNPTTVTVGSIAGVVVLGSIVLLVLLVTGVIGNRNRLTCTKTTNENGYVYNEKRIYKFDKGFYTEVNKILTFNYSNLTDDMYETEFNDIFESVGGVTKYGFGTQVTREGNIVTVTAYEPRYLEQKYDDIKTANTREGFSCK